MFLHETSALAQETLGLVQPELLVVAHAVSFGLAFRHILLRDAEEPITFRFGLIIHVYAQFF